MARMLIVAELIILLRDHMNRLEPDERRRLVALVRQGRGMPKRLSTRERRELVDLLAKTEPKAFVNRAARKVAGVGSPKGKGKGKR